jgi:hypothetical protein
MATQLQPSIRNMNLIAQDMHINGMWLASLKAKCIGRTPDADEDASWTLLEAKQEALQAEFCDTLHALTGLTWTRAINAMDAGGVA